VQLGRYFVYKIMLKFYVNTLTSLFYVHTVHFYCLLLFVATNAHACTHTHTHIHTHIYIYLLQYYIRNAPTCFGASAPSLGTLDIVY